MFPTTEVDKNLIGKYQIMCFVSPLDKKKSAGFFLFFVFAFVFWWKMREDERESKQESSGVIKKPSKSGA